MPNIQSPLPGTLYHQASPEEPVFKKAGDDVAVGDTLGLIEVMKSYIEVKAEVAGTFKSYLLDNEAAVQAGQDIIELED